MSCIYNSLGVPVAAGVLFPLTGILLSPVIAGAAMALLLLMTIFDCGHQCQSFKTY
ncbi:protein of unknown function, might belong to Copper-translocating P-type ATPase [Shewanella benthica]|uniref:Uncharacterized protein n=1 Tax=Shewanella benthica TaxID=43661 RepID=A0A330M899_9GAMM|nr:protein of unknown function, might belong to Copper-translocating P-type ATPase [Shewanella benthica]